MNPPPVFRPEKYPNKLGLLHLTSTEIERQILTYPLSFSQTRNYEVERGIQFPPFISAFYNFIYKNTKVPTQEEYFDFYIKVNRSHFEAANYSDEIIEGLKARVFRTHPSLVRDFHFNKLISEKLPEYEVVYNSALDIEHDIDAMLIKDGHYWAACLYTKTRRANVARGWKENRHERFTNVQYIEFPVTLDDSCKHGEFFLYGERELNQLLNYIQQHK